MNPVIECDFCNALPANYTVGMDERAKADFQINMGDLHSCPDCLAKAVDIGLRIFMECTVRKLSDKA